MSRLEKKCLLASTGAHALMALLLFTAPLIWVSHRHEMVTLPVLTIIPTRLVDGATFGGGSPDAKGEPAPAPPAEEAQPPAPPAVEQAPPAPPKTESKPPVREETKAPPTPKNTKSGEPVVSKKPSKTEEKGEAAPRKKRIELSFTRDTGANSKNSAANARRQANARAQAARAQYAAKVGSVVGAIGAGISSGTSIEAYGPGGEATADYAQFVEFFYRRAWSQPAEIDDDLATVKATVVIRRDGTVESFRITKRSGNATLDNSVQRLENLRSVAPFPEGATQDRRTFVINFNLKAEP